MRKTLAAMVVVAIAGAIAVSVTGQEEPLPVVIPKAAEIPLAEPAVVLAVEPVHEIRTPTLLEAARGNDYVTFNALYTAAKERGEDVSQFATLHELWTYSVTDPIGAFYGEDLHARLSRAFPGFATYIEEYRIIDSRGNVFYPSSETRAFLIDRVIEGRAPVVRVVQGSSSSAPTPEAGRNALTTPPTPAPAPEPARVSVTPPVVINPVPVVAEQPAPAPVAQVPQASVPVPVPSAAAAPVPAPAPIQAAQPARPAATRGILLLIIGLVGVGLLAVILRTPRETPPVKIVHNNIEPLRKPTVATPSPTDTTRAAG